MMNNKMPSDLSNVSVKQKIKQVVLLVLVVGAFMGIYKLCNLNSTAEKISIIALLVFLLGIVFAKVFPKIIDKSFWGTVEKVTIKTGVDMDWMFKRPWLQPRRNTVVLEINRPNGNHIFHQVYYEKAPVHSKQDELSLNIEKYSVGDHVFHLAGTDHTIVLPEPSDFRVQCSVCGAYNNIQQDVCSHCNHTLVKNTPLDLR